MTDLTSLGYPQGFHLGFSAALWWIYIIVIAILGVNLYLNAKKTDLINVKEMLRSKSITFICLSIQTSLIQVVVFFPDSFLPFFFSGVFFTTFLTAFYFYYWEKNLTTIKRIPTISVGTSAIFAVIGLIVSIFFQDLANFLLDFLIFVSILLIAVAFALYIYLIYGFSRDIKGGLITTVGWIWIGGTIIMLIALFIEYPPGAKILPEFIVLYFPPIIQMSGLMMQYYGITKLFPQISSFYAHTQRCAIHLGTIEKGTPIHYCSSCGIVYCEACFNKVIIKDGCWNCRKGIEREEEKKKDAVQILEPNKFNKHKEEK